MKFLEEPFQQRFLIIDGGTTHLSQQMNSIRFWKSDIRQSFVAAHTNSPKIVRRIIPAFGLVEDMAHCQPNRTIWNERISVSRCCSTHLAGVPVSL